MEVIIKLLRELVNRYDLKHHTEWYEPKYICKSFDTRNRYKNDKYKIPFDKPQCPIFEDNRCCGCCKLAPTCDHCVDCGCYGFTYATIGGGTEVIMKHKASQYYKCQKLKSDGTYDYEAYWEAKFLEDLKTGSFIIAEIDRNKIILKITNISQDYLTGIDSENNSYDVKFLDCKKSVYDSRYIAEIYL